MNTISDTPVTTTTQSMDQKIPLSLLAIGTAFFAYRYFNTKSGSSCKIIAGSIASLGTVALIKRLKSNP